MRSLWRLLNTVRTRAAVTGGIGAIVLLLGGEAPVWAQPVDLFTPAPVGNGVRGAPSGLTPAAWSSISAAIEQDQYGLRREGDTFRAVNRAHGFNVLFTREGVEVTPRAAEGSWRWGLRLTGYGYGSRQEKAAQPERVVTGNRIEYRRGGLVEWYVNERRGIEQGFTLSRPPKGRRGATPLSVDLRSIGDLRPAITEDGQGVAWHDAQGGVALWYRGLRVWDVTGRNLKARIEEHEGSLRLRVEDEGALYPLTIDPFIQQTGLMPSDAADLRTFGASFAISRDTIIIGAPGRDDDASAVYIFERNQGGANAWGEIARLTPSDNDQNFGTSVAIEGDTAVVGVNWQEEADDRAGAAYIYHRNQGGANKWGEVIRLAPSDPVPGRRFGVSVAISGDTVVVGAPGVNDFFDEAFVGVAYIFARDHGGANAWGEVATLSASDASVGDEFGRRVTINGDTAGVLATSNLRFPAYVFVRDQGGANAWGQVHSRDEVVALRINGDTAAAVSSGSATTHILARDLGGPDSWGAVATLVPSSGGLVTLASFTGDSAIISASGNTHVFARDRGGPHAWGEVVKLAPGVHAIEGHTALTRTPPTSALPLVMNVYELVSPRVNHLIALSVVRTSCCAASEFVITATLANTSAASIALPSLEVTELTGGNVLKNADGSPGGVGARLTPDVGDLTLDPGESRTVTFVIGLRTRKPFRFLVNVRGEVAP